MNEKMKRFLKSIHIENIDRFDLDFDLVTRNSFIHEQIDMLMVKKTPWSYDLLEEFQHGLETISYPYTLSISYIQKPTVYEAIQLFDDWHRSNYRFPHEIKLEAHGDSIVFVFESESQKEQYQDEIKLFKEFLEFLSYRFEIEQTIEELTPEGPSISKKKLEKIEAKAIKAIEEDDSEPEANETYYKDQREIEEEEHEEQLKEFTETYLSVSSIYFATSKSPGVMNIKPFSLSENTSGSSVGGVLPVCISPKSLILFTSHPTGTLPNFSSI